VRSVDWIFIIWDAGLDVTGRIHGVTESFFSILYKHERVAAQLVPHFLPYHIPREALIRNIIHLYYELFIQFYLYGLIIIIIIMQ
jgi:hypothetical protein